MSRLRPHLSAASAAALVLGLVSVPLEGSAEQTQRILAYVVATGSLNAHVAPARAAVRSAFGAQQVWFPPGELACAPETDAACASELETKNRAAAIVIVRIYWARAGCRPSYDSGGKLTGHRALRKREATIITLSRGQVVETVTVHEKSAPLDEEIARALKALAAKRGSGRVESTDDRASP